MGYNMPVDQDISNDVLKSYIVNDRIPVLQDKKRKKKIQRFRKISPYLAFCANYRDSKRDSQGKLTENVLEITRQAGSLWKNMSAKERFPWESKSVEMTNQARAAWDKKMSSIGESKSVVESSIPSLETISEMKKSEVLETIQNYSISVGIKASLKDMRNAVRNYYYPNPTQSQINSMKKSELLKLIEK